MRYISGGIGSNFHSQISTQTLKFPRLKMSGIEYVLYVVLAGSSLFTWSGAQSRYGSGLASCWRHKEHDYFNDFDFFAPEIAIFLWSAGASLGSEGS